MKKLAVDVDRLTATGQIVGDELVRSTLPRMNAALDQFTQSAEDIQRLARTLREDPQSLLVGRRLPPPGPGEPGYEATMR